MKFVVALALGLTVVGCAKEKEEIKVDPPSSLFETTDLDPGNVRSLRSTDIGYYVTDAAYDVAPSGEEASAGLQGDTDAEKCMEAKFDALTFSADQANAQISETVDVAECKPMDDEDMQFTYNSATVDVLLWFGCKNDDIEDLDGTTSAENQGKLPVFSYCKSEEDLQAMINIDVKFNVSTTEDGHTVDAEVRRIEAYQTKDGDPCAATYAEGNWTWTDGCGQYTIQKFDSFKVDGEAAEPGPQRYLSAVSTSLVEAHDPQPWYVSGSLAMKLDNWEGTVTFNGGDTAPTYTMTDGATTKSGTVGDFSLDAQKSWVKKLRAAFTRE